MNANAYCLGDSLTEGALGAAGVGVADPQPQNYPYFLGQILGCTTANFGKCGYNCRRNRGQGRRGVASIAP